MKELIWNRTTKVFLVGVLLGGILGAVYASYTTSMSLYYDCRYAGVTRIGESAFKCEQFSKVVLLTPDEVAKKAEKK
jgi:hypothetical protein